LNAPQGLAGGSPGVRPDHESRNIAGVWIVVCLRLCKEREKSGTHSTNTKNRNTAPGV